MGERAAALDIPGEDAPGDASSESSKLHELNRIALRCGRDVIRLEARPTELVTTVFGLGFRAARFRNAAAVCALQPDEITLQRRFGNLEFRTPRSRVQFDPDAWRVGFLDAESSRDSTLLLAYDSRGRPLVEFELDRGHSEIGDGAFRRFVHEIQEPTSFSVREVDRNVPHPAGVDPERVAEAWRAPTPYDKIEAVVEAFPTSRRALLEVLPMRWSGGLGFRSVRRLEAAVERGSLACRFEVLAQEFRSCVRTETVRVAGRGAGLVAVGDHEDVLADLRRVASAYYVRKPTGDGIRTAIELFDDLDRLQVRIRPARDASFDERLLWRSCLPCGLVCEG